MEQQLEHAHTHPSTGRPFLDYLACKYWIKRPHPQHLRRVPSAVGRKSRHFIIRPQVFTTHPQYCAHFVFEACLKCSTIPEPSLPLEERGQLMKARFFSQHLHTRVCVVYYCWLKSWFANRTLLNYLLRVWYLGSAKLLRRTLVLVVYQGFNIPSHFALKENRHRCAISCVS